MPVSLNPLVALLTCVSGKRGQFGGQCPHLRFRCRHLDIRALKARFEMAQFGHQHFPRCVQGSETDLVLQIAELLFGMGKALA